MTDFSYEGYLARREEEAAAFKKVVAEKLPNINFEEWTLTKNDVFDGEFTSNDGRKKIVVNTLNKYAFMANTYYGFVIEELEEAGADFTVIEGSYQDTVIEWKGSYGAVQKFRRGTGEKVKGVKLLRNTQENSKGTFITLDRKRYYRGDK